MNKTLVILAIFCGIALSLFSQSNDKVFYSSFRPEGWDIHISKDDGESFSPFAPNESLDYDAKISPDGQWVVFTSERLGPPHLFIKHIEGDTLPRLLVSSQSMQDQVDFSPDGQRMAFVSTHEGNADIYTLPFRPNDTLDIADAQNLTRDPGGDFRPSYSHDGQTIAFSSDRNHPIKPHSFFVFAMQRTGDIYTMPSTGGKATRLTDSDTWDGSPEWSLDDSDIFFYSDRNGAPAIFRMTRSGEDQTSISPEGFSCFSPLVTSENSLLFTNLDEEHRSYSIYGLDIVSSAIDSSLKQEMDMFNIAYHSSGLMVFHGGLKPTESDENKAGFEGDILVKNSPETAMLAESTIDLYGVRRAFAAPPSLDGKQIVYDYHPARGPEDLMTPYVFLLALLPLFALVWLLVGLVNSIRKRKTIPFWKYLLFGLLSVGVAGLIGALIFNQFVAMASPINDVRWLALGLCVLLALIGLAIRQFYKKRQSDQKAIAPLYKHYFFMFIANSLIMAYIALFCSSFFQVRPDFYAVDYSTNEVSHLFTFEPDPNFNPILVRIIDTKFTPDGEYLQFSVGGFRADPDAQGCVYRYHIQDKKLERITDLDSNNGFADFSKDNTSMVYRSGRTGTMDIFIEEGEALTNLTNSTAKENFPVISHDGSKIAFCSDVNGTDIDGKVKTMDLFIADRMADNTWSEPRQITSYTGQEGHPHFSPDGKWLIYTSEEFGINDEQPLVQPYIFSPQMYGEITAIRLEDGEKVRLTHNKWEDGAPLWISAD